MVGGGGRARCQVYKTSAGGISVLRLMKVVSHGHFGVRDVVFPARKLLQSYCDI